MENQRWMRTSMDDVVFDGRNKSYGAFVLRRLYDKHMARAMTVGIIFFLVMISSPQIIRMIHGMLPQNNENIMVDVVTLSEPPPIDPAKLPPPAAPKVEPPPVQAQIRFVKPKVLIDERVKEIEQLPPTVDQIRENVISTQTVDGNENGVDISLIEPSTGVAAVIEEKKEEEVFSFVEQMPTFPDGLEAMYIYINQLIKYPAIARETGISGVVVVQFVVSKEGEIQKAHVVRGIGGGCNDEALRIVNGMPRWKPGKHNGVPVPVTFTLPIKFVLQ